MGSSVRPGARPPDPAGSWRRSSAAGGVCACTSFSMLLLSQSPHSRHTGTAAILCGMAGEPSCSSTTRTTCARCSRPRCATSASTCHPAANGREALDAVGDGAARPHRARRDAARPRRVRGVPAPAHRGRAARRCCSSPRATRTDDKVRGLTLGGDDYLVKPFSLEELVARVNAVLRRAGLARAGTRAAVRRPRDGRRRPPRRARRRTRSRCRRPSTTCCATCSSTRAGSCRRRRSSTTCGSTTSAATAASSRPTSATCAARSTPPSPA